MAVSRRLIDALLLDVSQVDRGWQVAFYLQYKYCSILYK